MGLRSGDGDGHGHRGRARPSEAVMKHRSLVVLILLAGVLHPASANAQVPACIPSGASR